MIGFKIAGWGTYTPKNAVASAALDERLGKSPGWTEKQFGITSRGIASSDETSSAMAAGAARSALAQTGWDEGEFDALIGGCGVMEQPIPSTAILVQDRLGLGQSGIPAFDVNQTCLSFVLALDVAAMGIAAGRWKRVVIFASDIASAGLNPHCPKTMAIFGDGAAAIAIEADDTGECGLLSSHAESYGAGNQLAMLRSGGTRLRIEEGYDALKLGSYFEMDAFGIFKAAARCLPGVIEKALAHARVTSAELKTVICHQASAPGVEYVRRLFEPAPERVLDIFAHTGNQIAASIPTVLVHALNNGRAATGDKIMLLGTAAGVSATAMILQI